MIRSAPTNYLLTAAAGGLLWVVLAIGVGSYLGDNVALQEMTTEEFVSTYRLTLAAATVLALANCFLWYFRGSRERTAVDLAGARRLWVGSLLAQVMLAALALVVIAVLLQAESLTLGDYGLIFVAFSLLTYVFFWVATLLMSPRIVEYIPLGKR